MPEFIPEQTPTPAPNQPATRFQCRHLRAAGARCGSPALRHEHFCFYHHASRRPIPAHPYPDADREPFAFPVVEDRAGILLALSQVLARIAANDLDPKRAGLLLYGLQVAATVLPKEPSPNLTSPNPSHPNPSPKHPAPSPRNPLQPQALPTTIADPTDLDDLTFDPALGTLAPITELPSQPPKPKTPTPKKRIKHPQKPGPNSSSNNATPHPNTDPTPAPPRTPQPPPSPPSKPPPNPKKPSSRPQRTARSEETPAFRLGPRPITPPRPSSRPKRVARSGETPAFRLCHPHPPTPTNSRHLDRSAQRAVERPRISLSPPQPYPLPPRPHTSNPGTNAIRIRPLRQEHRQLGKLVGDAQDSGTRSPHGISSRTASRHDQSRCRLRRHRLDR